MNPVERRHARHYALQAMYQWQVTGTTPREIEEHFIASQIKHALDIDYFKELVHGIPAKSEELDACIVPFLKRPLKELDPIELGVLRLATYELLHRIDIPYRVVINEALEMAKKFGSVEGYKFVNGVLDQIAKQVRSTELKQASHK